MERETGIKADEVVMQHASESAQVRRVNSFHELLTTPFVGEVNALCWERKLAGDFREIVSLLGQSDGEAVTALDEARLLALPVSAAGRIAVEVLVADQRLLRQHGLDPVLNLINGYPRDESPGLIATDVFSFHVDSAPVATDTWLCTYHGPASEGLPNANARRRVDIPETRAALLRHFGGADDDTFQAYLTENCYDLHYAPVAPAQTFSFGSGHLWKIAVDYPGSPVPPCVHRAPATVSGEPARLLLIS